jgi:hypothetical protein
MRSAPPRRSEASHAAPKPPRQAAVPAPRGAHERIASAARPRNAPPHATVATHPQPKSITPGASVARNAPAPAESPPPPATAQEPAEATAAAPASNVVASIAPSADVAVAPAETVRVAPPPVAHEPPQDAPKKRPRRDVWHDTLRDVLKIFGPVDQRAAPVEERSTDAPRVASASPPAPRATAVQPPARAEPVVEDLGAQGRRLLAESVPAVAAQARLDVTRVLWTAAMAQSPAQDRSVVDAAYVAWRSERSYPPELANVARAPALYQQSRQAYGAGRDAEALDLALRAFAANPRDPDIASFLALLHLRASQPETARQLALYTLAYSGSRRSLRLDDWNMLAIASALTGREVEASRALLVELSLSTDVDRSCREAQRAYRTYGDRMRVPVESLLHRIYAQGRGYESTACAWPAGYRTVSR